MVDQSQQSRPPTQSEQTGLWFQTEGEKRCWSTGSMRKIKSFLNIKAWRHVTGETQCKYKPENEHTRKQYRDIISILCSFHFKNVYIIKLSFFYFLRLTHEFNPQPSGELSLTDSHSIPQDALPRCVPAFSLTNKTTWALWLYRFQWREGKREGKEGWKERPELYDPNSNWCIVERGVPKKVNSMERLITQWECPAYNMERKRKRERVSG